MGIDDFSGFPEGGEAVDQAAAEEATRRAERAAELDRLMRGFEERMAAKPDEASTPSDKEKETFSPFTQEEARTMLSEARDFLSEKRRLEYFETASGWGKLKQLGLPDYEKSRTFIKIIISVLQRHPLEATLTAMLANETPGEAGIICILHWLYLKEHFPFAMQDLSTEEAHVLADAEKFLQKNFCATPELAEIFVMMGLENGDMTLSTAATLARSRGIPVFSDELLLQETAFTGNSFRIANEWLDLQAEEIDEMRQKDMKVLDLGCGLSDFASELRKRGIKNVHTLDELSYDELMQKTQSMNPRVRESLGLEKAMLAFDAESLTAARSFHKKGKSADAHRLFGEEFFHRIFAVDSITQPALCPIYRRNSMAFWKNIQGPLRALSKDGGELRATTNPYILFSQADMEAYLLPFLFAMRAGSFEIPGAYGRDGKFSFELFMRHYVSWNPERMPPFRVRRNPDSNPDIADTFMQRVISGRSLEAGFKILS